MIVKCKVIAILVSIGLLAGCDKGYRERESSGELVTLSFDRAVVAVSDQASVARVSETKAYSGVIGVLKGDSWVSEFKDYSGAAMSIDDKGNVVPTQDPFYLFVGRYNFCSIASDRAAGLPTRTDDSYPLTFGKAADDAPGGDLIYSRVEDFGVTPTNYSVQFKYDHLYGKVKFVLTTNDANLTDKLAGATVVFSGFCNGGTVSIRDGAVVPAATFTGSMSAKDTEYFALPQDLSVNPLTFKIKVGDLKGETTFKSSAANIAANLIRTFTLTVSGGQAPSDPATVTIAISTADWNNHPVVDNDFGESLPVTITLSYDSGWDDNIDVDNEFGK